MPTSMIATISNVVATGRRIKRRDGLIDHCGASFAPPAGRVGGAVRSLRDAPALAALPFSRLRPLRLSRPLTCSLGVPRPRGGLARCRLRLSLVARSVRRSVVCLFWRQGDLSGIAQPVGTVDPHALA